jgi:hypothetical protein
MSIVVYVSGHGLGHSARQVEILRRIPSEIPLIIKTRAPEAFWRSEVNRPFTFLLDSFDVGCIQKNGLEIDIPATFSAVQEIIAANEVREQSEIAFLKEAEARLVVTDIAAFPLKIASRCGIPSLCIANFTWVEIYRAFLGEHADFAEIIERYVREYECATALLKAGLALEMPYFSVQEDIGLVARTGVRRREDVLQLLPDEARNQRLALVYVSGWGLPINYGMLERYSDWQFISLDPPPILPSNWTVLSRYDLPHPDLVASMDCVISKPGYGIVGECLAAGTPFLYPPRPQFAEYFAIDAGLTEWQGGIRMTEQDFHRGDWRMYLDSVPSYESVPGQKTNGGERAAAAMLKYYGSHSAVKS